jgi:GntR family transcriptional regulator/MocR family aminotransferase
MAVDFALTVPEPPGQLVQERVYQALRRDILEGRFAPGQRLPSTRALARALRVSRTTAILAYEQLAAEGYVESRQASGTFVSRTLPTSAATPATSPPIISTEARASARAERLSRWGERLLAARSSLPPAGQRALPYDFRPGQPDWSAFPRALWQRLVSRRWAAASAELASYGDPAGYRPLREAIAAHLARSRGVRCDADQVVVVNGSQQAADLLARIWLDPGDAAAVEDPGYPEAALALRASGVFVLPTPVDGEGLQVERLPRPGEPQAPRLVYVTPSHQFPTGTVMSLRRRLALLEWASERGALLVEDDYDSEFRYEGRPLESLQGLDQAGVVAYVGSFSTALFPPLRVGYAVLPRRLLEPFVAAKSLADRQTATLDQQVLADFLRGGHYLRHLRAMGRLYRARRDALLAALGQSLGDLVEPGGAGAGLHLVAWLSPGLDERRIADAALDQGVAVYPIGHFALGLPTRSGLLMGFAALQPATIRAGVERLAAIVRGAPAG